MSQIKNFRNNLAIKSVVFDQVIKSLRWQVENLVSTRSTVYTVLFGNANINTL